jgi:HK97 family phage prohead protease
MSEKRRKNERREYREIMNQVQRRYMPAAESGIQDIREEGNESSYKITGTPIVYGRMAKLFEWDDYEVNEIIEAGAAAEALKNAEQVLLWNHNSAMPMAARKNNTLTVQEDDNGVHITADVSGTSWGRNGFEAIRSKLVDSMSFGFFIKRDGYTTARTEREGKTIITRTIHKIDRIIDFSPVTYPAYKDTEVTARCADQIIDDIEEMKKADEERAAVRRRIDGLIKEFAPE